MSTAAAAAEAPPPAAKGKKKLIILIAAAVLLLGGGGGAAFMMLKKKPVDDDGEDSAQVEKAESKAKAAPKHDAKHPPAFAPLEPFTVNLADREVERYAQVAVTLELDDAKTGDDVKAFMPAIRNNILMVLAHKRSTDLLDRAGKEKLADEVMRETERALGVEPLPAGGASKKSAEPRPVRAVQFSNFIIQ